MIEREIAPKKIYKFDTRNFLTSLDSALYAEFMARLEDIRNSMHDRLMHDIVRAKKLRDRLNEVRSAYLEYLDVQKELQAREKSIRTLAGVMGAYEFDAFIEAREPEVEDHVDLSPEEANEIRKNLTVWEVIEQYLQFMPEAQVVELEHFFKWIGYKATRQAIESAIATHPKLFKSVKRGRERFVSLKGK